MLQSSAHTRFPVPPVQMRTRLSQATKTSLGARLQHPTRCVMQEKIVPHPFAPLHEAHTRRRDRRRRAVRVLFTPSPPRNTHRLLLPACLLYPHTQFLAPPRGAWNMPPAFTRSMDNPRSEPQHLSCTRGAHARVPLRPCYNTASFSGDAYHRIMNPGATYLSKAPLIIVNSTTTSMD